MIVTGSNRKHKNICNS